MKIATLNRGKESKYLNQYPLVDEDDIYKNDHLKESHHFYFYITWNSLIHKPIVLLKIYNQHFYLEEKNT